MPAAGRAACLRRGIGMVFRSRRGAPDRTHPVRSEVCPNASTRNVLGRAVSQR
ncbi:hypothetical protein B0G74_3270 [Paraburkholderia sp. BL9I2N2]|nr:hypothetical protein B0G74_3270 [Paraburkholderia sp. BL9I2N2]